jgi:WD40 repeat protein/tRNA A-37 threonylcarbamoyl transferase component Bud32
MFTHACSWCGQPGLLPTELGNQTFRCPHCGQATSVAARPGQVAGYEILEELGRGAMGVVFKARQPGLGRLVALKMILDASLSNQEQHVRFLAEAEAVARLNHPSIVRIHAIGEHDGHPFFSMEYVGGGSLAQYLNGTPLPARQAAALTEQLAEAVQYAHEQGIVHRDLKPANILLSFSRDPEGSAEAGALPSGSRLNDVVPRITDFGLAKHLDRAEGPTRTGAILGTPSYMAPEQTQGDSRRIGPAADVWALGATLYEMLTGRPPFQGANVAETLLQVACEDPIPPRQLQPGLPCDLETICLKCLAKSPARRYPSARALADDLQSFLDGRPILARPVGRLERMVKWARRRPAAAGIVALIVLALVVAQAAGALLAGYEYRQRRLSENLTDQTEEAKARAETSASDAKRLAALQAEARKQADQRRDQAVRSSESARLALADHALERGIDLCAHQGDIRQGMLWFARCLQLTQVSQPVNLSRARSLERAARLNLASWAERQLARVVRLFPHPCGVEAASFHPRKSLVATGGTDGFVRLWDTATGRLVGSPLPHAGPVRCLAWNADGTSLAVGTGDGWQAYGPGVRSKGEARVHDMAGGKARILKHPGTVWAVALSADGRLLLTGCNDGKCRLWNAGATALPKTIQHRAPVSGVAFLPDGTGFVTATCGNWWDGWSRTAQIQTFDLSGARRGDSAISHTNIRALSVLADGRAITGCNNSEVQFWDLQAGEELSEPFRTGSPVVSMGVSQDGSTLVTAGTDFRVRVFKAVEDETISRVGADLYVAAPLQAVALAPDGKSFLTGDTWSARLWRLDPPVSKDVPLLSPGRISRLVLSGAASHVVTWSEAGELRAWNAGNGRPAGKAFRPPRGVDILDVTPDGATVLVLGGGQLQSFRSATGEPRGKAIPTDFSVMDARISPDGKRAVAGGKDGDKGCLCLYDLATGKRLGKVNVTGWCGAVLFVADGKSVLTGTWYSAVHQFAVPTLKRIGRPVSTHGAVFGLASTRDGRTFLAGAWGPMVSVLGQTSSGRALGLPLRHRADEAAFTPDGRIALTGLDNSLRLWDVASGKQVGPNLPMRGWSMRPWATAVFADDQTLVAMHNDGVVRRWPVPQPIEGSPTRLELWVQALTGMRLDPHGGVSMLRAEEWQAVRQQLDALPGPRLP